MKKKSNLSTTLSTSFRITRLIEHKLYASVCDITFDINFSSSNLEQQQTHLTAMRTWIEDILDNCVAFSVHSELDTQLLGEISNHIMFCPDDPHDHILLMLIVAKLNAIGENVVTVDNAILNADTSQGWGNSLMGNPQDMLPNAEEWMGEIRYWNQPWWNRPDGGMMDIPVADDGDPNIKPDILIELIPTSILDSISDDTTTENLDITKTAEIIRPDFKFKTRND